MMITSKILHIPFLEQYKTICLSFEKNEETFFLVETSIMFQDIYFLGTNLA